MKKLEKEKLIKPVCPICKTEMCVVHYEGYYDEHIVWSCNCNQEDLQKYVEQRWKGNYA